jgi:hypothetical protein
MARAHGLSAITPAEKRGDMKMNETQQAVWDNFTEDCPATFHRVETLLSQGENVVVVLGDGVSACHPYSETTEPSLAAMTLQKELVRQTGVPLPIGGDGRRRFAFLAWKSTDPIDAPSEISTVALANSAPADRDLYNFAKACGIGKSMKTITLDEI